MQRTTPADHLRIKDMPEANLDQLQGKEKGVAELGMGD